MKTKLEMAHEWYLKHLEVHESASVHGAWQYADAMQAEADKRENEEQDKLKQDDINYHDALVEIGLEEWQPDWSQAPDNALTWAINSDGYASWALYKDGHYFSTVQAPSFGYTGDWRNSLRKRPK